MLTGATSLDLVREELFASMGEAEDLLQQFLEDRHNGSLLQQAIESLQQLRGTFELIELNGATVLLTEMVALATDVPEHDGTERNGPLSSLCDSLFLLERYLEQCRHQGFERPELLLPAINELRKHRIDAAPLPESHFYQLDVVGLNTSLRPGSSEGIESRAFNRLRQMYQLGLLALIRDDGITAATPLMKRALQRWESYLASPVATLCWVASAALEAVEETPLHLTNARKRLFAQVDREVRKRNGQHEASDAQPPRQLLGELLYLVALAGDNSPRCAEVKAAFALPELDYTEHEILQAFDRLRGPGVDVMRSVAEALREEIAAIKDLLDLLARNAGDPEQSLETLKLSLQRLWKTFRMLEIEAVSSYIESTSGKLETWRLGDTGVLEKIADAVLQAETAVDRLDGDGEPDAAAGTDEADEPLALKEARIVLIEESQAGLALAKRAVTAYMESGNDVMHLMNVPDSLETVRGGLIFLGMSRAANVIRLAACFIKENMLDRKLLPHPQQLEVLADALTGIEFYLESAERSSVTTADVLALAEDSLAELGFNITEV
ncbi:ferrous iron transporter B [Pseudomonas saliphila]|uniref:ferrous iron transporter B n=1 Tax=Pseudomonas saliphila TaxID=2586906 RepID=UPI001239723F|nr:ferrous iron transporter B [Pseudomonas saliphila]